MDAAVRHRSHVITCALGETAMHSASTHRAHRGNAAHFRLSWPSTRSGYARRPLRHRLAAGIRVLPGEQQTGGTAELLPGTMTSANQRH